MSMTAANAIVFGYNRPTPTPNPFRCTMNMQSNSAKAPLNETPRAIFSSTILHTIAYHLETLLLFTWTDYKACLWIWLHLLLCNVSNQCRSKEEDKMNRPWRPVPAGRLTEAQAVQLRWATAGICVAWSATYGFDLVLTTLGLIFTTFMYDEMGLAGHVIGKNFCNIGGYTTFEIGATKIIGSYRDLDLVASLAVTISGILIFTTIQAQDFPDVKGDTALGRITFPIYAPEFSRQFTVLCMIAWSVFLSWFWDIGNGTNFVFVLMGTYVGMRYYEWRTEMDDKKSYLIFNMWLMLAHCLPLHARTNLLAF
ncbi:hypothetical protein D9758_006900 [Tetrapyrgos nigripes]|uniref:Uncharacterized protein n=1 Tax=Tetrapyrgos nigripes TaxID=182062 RepID=A0A8H5GSG9_9AGAR|nr:hypothetical protein D9758_006900 [Tetrapyrgos nigripes]